MESLGLYLNYAPLLTIFCVFIFYLSGFYTYGRAYRSKYKALLIFQAVSLAYLVFGFSAYYFHSSAFSFSPFSMHIPRSVLVLSWLISITLVGGLRVGSALWRRATWSEAKIWGKPRRNSIRNVLVIGGAGYIGSVLCRDLIKKGYDVTVLDALLYGNDSILGLLKEQNFDFVKGDFRNIEDVIRSMQYADAVVHLGAIVGDPACALDEKLTLEINLAATRLIAETARGFGVQRFIFASTCSVYGASDEILDEKSRLNPVSLYARTKIDSEKILLAMNDNNFSPIILRFATVYGLSPRPRFDLVINLLAAKAVSEGSITIFGGNQWRPFIHVRDVSRAIIQCLEAPIRNIKGQIFNVGSDEQNFRIRELGRIIETLIPGTNIIIKKEDQDRRNYRVSFKKIRKLIGFSTKYKIEDGILEIKSAIESGFVEDYRLPKYSNYRTLSDETNGHLIRRNSMVPLYSDVSEKTGL
jgi:nucleoside-diphosphate-sugar epimerase